MARPRTPTEVLEARGAFINHPERKTERANEPVPTAKLGGPPKEFTKEQKALWRRLAKEAPPGVLCNCDRYLMIMTVKLIDKEMRDTINSGERSQLITCLGKMGLTPSDRSKVSAAPQPKKVENDPWAKFTPKPN